MLCIHCGVNKGASILWLWVSHCQFACCLSQVTPTIISTGWVVGGGGLMSRGSLRLLSCTVPFYECCIWITVSSDNYCLSLNKQASRMSDFRSGAAFCIIPGYQTVKERRVKKAAGWKSNYSNYLELINCFSPWINPRLLKQWPKYQPVSFTDLSLAASCCATYPSIHPSPEGSTCMFCVTIKEQYCISWDQDFVSKEHKKIY